MSIKKLREETGLSQSKFAQIFDIPVYTLQEWEQGRRNPPKYMEQMLNEILIGRGILEKTAIQEQGGDLSQTAKSIVRCKDCTHYDCTRSDKCRIHGSAFQPENELWYCADAERKG